MVDILASAAHYLDHLAPTWKALDPGARGIFWTPPELIPYANRLGVDAQRLPLEGDPAPTLVSAYGDLRLARSAGRRVAIAEHGAGQSYTGLRSGSYAGGGGRDADLFLHPGIRPAQRDRKRHPRTRIEVVGCPKLDTLPARQPGGDRPVVCFSFHWDCGVVEEARSGFLFLRNSIPAIVQSGKYEVIGHAHPRAWDGVSLWYARNGIEPVRSFDEVCRRADLYVIDNSSTMFEFAATGRPVVVVTPNVYRRYINHGLRFWECATIGPEVDQVWKLPGAIAEALADSPKQQALREAAVNLVYAYRTGAAERTARILEGWA